MSADSNRVLAVTSKEKKIQETCGDKSQVLGITSQQKKRTNRQVFDFVHSVQYCCRHRSVHHDFSIAPKIFVITQLDRLLWKRDKRLFCFVLNSRVKVLKFNAACLMVQLAARKKCLQFRHFKHWPTCREGKGVGMCLFWLSDIKALQNAVNFTKIY